MWIPPTLVHTTRLFLRATVLTFGPKWGESKSRPSVGLVGWGHVMGHVVGHVVHDVVHVCDPCGACGPCLWTMWSPPEGRAPLRPTRLWTTVGRTTTTKNHVEPHKGLAPLRPTRIWTTMVEQRRQKKSVKVICAKKCP